MVLHLSIGFLKTRSGLEPVPRYEPNTYHSFNRRFSHCAVDAGLTGNKFVLVIASHYHVIFVHAM